MTTTKNTLTIFTAAMMLLASSAHATWETPGAPVQQLAAGNTTPPPVGITTTVQPSYFRISADDVEKAIAEQLTLQGVEAKAEVKLNAGSPTVFAEADHSLQPVIHALQIDQQSKRWQAQLYVVAGGKTETVKPISGFYNALVDVPMLTRQLRQMDVIEASDITMRPVSERTMRKDTITDAQSIIGRSPRNIISSNRAIRLSEITSPIVIKKGDAVEMTYTTPYMHIKATGVALEDGAKGGLIRIKNDKSEKAVSGRVQAAGHVEVNTSAAM